MRNLKFDWDDKKNRTNQKKHGVSFEEAQTVFFDDEYGELDDRFLLLGVSIKLRLLLVCHCLRDKGNTIRIISARKATKKEQREYPWTRK
ncbi:MAG: BrnT family toxin [Phycisphaerae bacterium]|nr:BrnT family toxin [Phycisphaerae bacterium]